MKFNKISIVIIFYTNTIGNAFIKSMVILFFETSKLGFAHKQNIFAKKSFRNKNGSKIKFLYIENKV